MQLYNPYEAALGPADKHAGTIKFKASASSYTVKNGDKTEERPLNLIEISITEAEKASVMLDDVLFDLNHPVTVKVNGKVVVDKQMIERNWDLFFGRIFPARAFMMAYVGGLPLEFDLLPQVKEEKKEEKPAEEQPAEEAPAEEKPAEEKPAEKKAD